MKNPTEQQQIEYRRWFDTAMRVYADTMKIESRAEQEKYLAGFACGDTVLLMLDGENYEDSIWLKVDPHYDVELFLKESNAIEGVYDDDSLEQSKYAWEYLIAQDKLSAGVILKTHKILMLHQPLRPDEKGYFRKIEVSVGGRLGLHHSEIPEAIKNWRFLVEETIATYHKDPEKAQRFIQEDHVRYEVIHPFVDGNGRTGRMFMNWQRVKCGLPVMIIYERAKQDYYKWFRI